MAHSQIGRSQQKKEHLTKTGGYRFNLHVFVGAMSVAGTGEADTNGRNAAAEGDVGVGASGRKLNLLAANSFEGGNGPPNKGSRPG